MKPSERITELVEEALRKILAQRPPSALLPTQNDVNAAILKGVGVLLDEQAEKIAQQAERIEELETFVEAPVK